MALPLPRCVESTSVVARRRLGGANNLLSRPESDARGINASRSRGDAQVEKVEILKTELAARKPSTAQPSRESYSVDGRPTHLVSSAIVTTRLSAG